MLQILCLDVIGKLFTILIISISIFHIYMHMLLFSERNPTTKGENISRFVYYLFI